MSMFHQSPDGHIYVRVDDVGTYRATPGEFAEDFGELMRPLPAGVVERVYEPGRRHALMDRESVLDGGPMPFELGDRAIAEINMLLDKMEARQQAELDAMEDRSERIIGPTRANAPTPTPEQAAQAEQVQQMMAADMEKERQKRIKEGTEWTGVGRIPKLGEPVRVKPRRRGVFGEPLPTPTPPTPQRQRPRPPR